MTKIYLLPIVQIIGWVFLIAGIFVFSYPPGSTPAAMSRSKNTGIGLMSGGAVAMFASVLFLQNIRIM